MTRRMLIIALFCAACALSACAPASESGGKVVRSGKVGALTVELANEDGVLRHGNEDFTVTFKDASGRPVDVGAAALNFYMPAMGTMPAMNAAAALTTTGTPGVYRAKAQMEMGGEWQAQVTYDGPAGKGQGSFPVTAQ